MACISKKMPNITPTELHLFRAMSLWLPCPCCCTGLERVWRLFAATYLQLSCFWNGWRHA